MNELLSAPRLVDLVLIVMLAEFVLLLVLRHRLGKGPRAAEAAAMLLAGALLLLAWRSAAAGAAAHWTALLIGAAGLAHAVDLRRRWRG